MKKCIHFYYLRVVFCTRRFIWTLTDKCRQIRGISRQNARTRGDRSTSRNLRIPRWLERITAL